MEDCLWLRVAFCQYTEKMCLLKRACSHLLLPAYLEKFTHEKKYYSSLFIWEEEDSYLMQRASHIVTLPKKNLLNSHVLQISSLSFSP